MHLKKTLCKFDIRNLPALKANIISLQAFLVGFCVHHIISTGSTPFYNAFFGHGTGPILLDDLLCTGSEARIIDCPRFTSQGIGTYDFCPNGHGEDAGVRCVPRK